MPTSSWDQKRAQIAQTMLGGVAPGGLSLGNAGATFRSNPIMGWGSQGAAAQAPAAQAPGGQGQGQTVAYTGGGQNMARPAMVGGPSVQVGIPALQRNRDPRLMSVVGGQGQAAPAQQGLMGPAGGGQMARMAQMPGFNYVPPTPGPAPVPQQAGMAGGPWTRDDRLAFLRGRQTPANAMAYTQALGQGAYNYNPGGSGNNRQRH